MAARVALFGGSFNPIHHGHLIIARAVAERLEIDPVILLPSRTPPHKNGDGLASGEDRLAMVRAAIEGDDLFAVDEHDLLCEGPSYTATTVAHFRRRLPADTELFWILGADSLRELHTWYRPDEILRHCRIITARRPGSTIDDLPDLQAMLGEDAVRGLLADVLETPYIEISATQIRQRVARRQAIRYLTPPAVEEYITRHGLYRA
jgi:nicotinate-nucleotide adenylyltransferase